MAKLVVWFGPVFGGKTRQLIERIKKLRKKEERVTVLHQSLVGSRDGTLPCHDDTSTRLDAIAIRSPWQILEFVEKCALCVDQIEGFETREAIQVFEQLLQHPIVLLVAGRELDCEGKRNELLTYLIGRADDARWCVGTCTICLDAASYTFNRHYGRTIMVEDAEPRCERCFQRGMEELHGQKK